jgi:hypothetical protein
MTHGGVVTIRNSNTEGDRPTNIGYHRPIVHSAFIEHTDGLTKKRTNTSCARTAQKRKLESEIAKGGEQEDNHIKQRSVNK